MKMIVTHTGPDYDAVSSAVAAHLLWPDAYIAFTGRMNDLVQKFISLHKDHFPIVESNVILLDAIDHLIVVDTGQKRRISNFAQVLDRDNVKVTVFDHHPIETMDIKADEFYWEQSGSCTAILVKMLRDKHIPLTDIEATTLALGIYSDTGHFTYSNTTRTDIEALLYLMDNGLRMELLRSQLDDALNTSQTELLQVFAQNRESHFAEGLELLLMHADTPGIEAFGLGQVIDAADEFFGFDACIVCMEEKGKLTITGRSRDERLSILELLAPFGAKGHFGAASATLRDKPWDEVKATILERMETTVQPALRARDLMTSPVKMLPHNTTVDSAMDQMIENRHSGFPVEKDGRLVGIISRRDIARARYKNRGGMPISGFMNSQPLYVGEDMRLQEIKDFFAQNNIGRAPVLSENNEVIGIVTRTDILRAEYGEANNRVNPIFLKNTESVFKTYGFKNEETLRILRLIGEEANRRGDLCMVVGGFVRDLLLQKGGTDIDITVSHDAIGFANHLQSILGGSVVEHARFNTATLYTHPFEIDIVTARKEKYPDPASLPQVELADFRNDLYRRDFTVNSLAVILNPQYFGVLLDIFGGALALRKGILSVLHDQSFVEDPTRIFRLARFACRYGWQPDDHTFRLMEEALAENYIERLSKDRIRNELALFFKEKNGTQGLDLLLEWGVMEHLLPGAALSAGDHDRLLKLPEAADLPLKLLTLFVHHGQESLMTFWDRIGISPKRAQRLDFLQKMCLNINERIAACADDHELLTLYRSFRGPEMLLWKAFATEDSQIALLYCRDVIAERKLQLRPADLAKAGLPAGSENAARCMEVLARLKANGKLLTAADEYAALMDYIKENPDG